MSSTMKDRGTRTTAARQALVDRMAELKPALDRKMRVRLPDDLRADLQSVTLHQLEALGLLERGGLRMSELARELDISEPASTALADRLVRGGLVERHADPADGRGVRLSLTSAGRARQREIGRRHARGVARAMTAGLTRGELAQLETICRKLAWANDKSEVPIP